MGGCTVGRVGWGRECAVGLGSVRVIEFSGVGWLGVLARAGAEVLRLLMRTSLLLLFCIHARGLLCEREWWC